METLALDALPDAADAKAVARAPRPLARRALRRWLRAEGGGDHPPSLAEVDRTLAVAAGSAVGTELTGRPAGAPHGGPAPGGAARLR